MLADISVFPYVFGGGLILAVVSGIFLSLAALMAGVIRRRRSRQKLSSRDSGVLESEQQPPENS